MRKLQFLVPLVCLVLLAGCQPSSGPSIGKLRPTATPQVSEQAIFEDAGDGKVTLKLLRKNLDGKVQLSVVNNVNQTTTSFYTASASSDVLWSVPHNTWSPDDKQVFLTLTKPEDDDYYVFKADGTPYRTGQPYLDVNSYWQTYSKTLTIRDVTGWAANNLLVVYTQKANGTNGPHYWFVTDTQRFVPLAH
jgi:hypothetical protein